MNTVLWAFFIILATAYPPPLDPARLVKDCEAKGGVFKAYEGEMFQPGPPDSPGPHPVKGLVVYCEKEDKDNEVPMIEPETSKHGA